MTTISDDLESQLAWLGELSEDMARAVWKYLWKAAQHSNAHPVGTKPTPEPFPGFNELLVSMTLQKLTAVMLAGMTCPAHRSSSAVSWGRSLAVLMATDARLAETYAAAECLKLGPEIVELHKLVGAEVPPPCQKPAPNMHHGTQTKQ